MDHGSGWRSGGGVKILHQIEAAANIMQHLFFIYQSFILTGPLI